MTLDALESALARAAERPRFLADGAAEPVPDPTRLATNFAAIETELDTPAPSRLARLLTRFRVSDRTIPLVTATPALRRSWIIAVVVGVLFALSAAGSSTQSGVDRIVLFLTMAPLIPLAGVALAFGPGVDPTHEIAVAAPIDGFRLFLIRAVTVVGASIALLSVASLLAPEGGAYRVAWLLPALAATSLTLALATRFDPRLAAAGVGGGWITLVVIITDRGSAADAFGPAVQLASLVVTAAGLALFVARRKRLDHLTVS